MIKKILLGALAVVVVGSIGLFFWARSILARDTVRTAVAARMTQALGQPVSIGGIGASIFPRVAVDLDNLTIGPKANIRVGTLKIGTDFRALLSRRIEHGSVRLTGARIELPLPPFSGGAAEAPPSSASSSSPVEIGSIDEIVLSGVEIVSGGRTLRGDVEVVPRGNGVLVKRVALRADKASIDISGEIADLSGPTGQLTVKAGALDFAQLLAFVSDFSQHAGFAAGPPGAARPSKAARAPAPSAMNLAVKMDADRATLGTLLLEKLSGRARITSAGVTLDPVSFGVFGGRYDGTLALALGDVPDFRLRAKLSGIDVGAATTYAGSPNVMTGRLAGDIDLSGRGLDAKSVTRTARGTVRVDVTNGIVKNLGLIQAVVLATSMREGALNKSASAPRDEPFTRLGGTLALANGEATSQNLQFESKDVTLGAAGAVRLDGSVVDLKGKAQLSDALTQQAGRDLVRYTQEQGRVTLPATIGGSVDHLQVRIDAADLARRAVTNRAKEEVTKGLGRLLRRR